MTKRKAKVMVRFLRKAQELLTEIGIAMRPENHERGEQLFNIAIEIPEKLEKEYNLDKRELAFVTHIAASLICSASADAIEKAKEAEINEH